MGNVATRVEVSGYDPARVHALERYAVAFTVVDRSTDDGVGGPHANVWPGVFWPMLPWQLEAVEEHSR